MAGDMEEELDYILTVIRPRNVLQLNNNSASQALEQKDERREDIKWVVIKINQKLCSHFTSEEGKKTKQ